MTNLVFIEHKKIPKDHAKAIKQDFIAYAISIALKFPRPSIPEKDRIRIAKRTVRDILKRYDLSTKNIGSMINDEVVRNLEEFYFTVRRNPTESKRELLEMIQVVRLLRRLHPRKYRRLFISLQEQLNRKQKAIFNIYLIKRKELTYKAVSRLAQIPVGTIKGQMKGIVKGLNRVFRTQKVKRGR
jgi:hypothetical protein